VLFLGYPHMLLTPTYHVWVKASDMIEAFSSIRLWTSDVFIRSLILLIEFVHFSFLTNRARRLRITSVPRTLISLHSIFPHIGNRLLQSLQSLSY